MFVVAYDYLCEIGHHTDFRSSLYDKQNDEDKKLRDEFIDFTTKEFLEDFRENLEANPDLLSAPIPEAIFSIYSEAPKIPVSGGDLRWIRPSKEDRIKWQREHVDRLRADLIIAVQELEKLEKI
jgi:hypothetical protein